MFDLRESSNVWLVIYDALGAAKKVLVNGRKNAGEHNTKWDGKDDSGGQLPTGVYFIKFSVGGNSETRKILLIK